MLAIAGAIARRTPELFSLEMWGGATFDTTMRFLREDPWDRLGDLRVTHDIAGHVGIAAGERVAEDETPDRRAIGSELDRGSGGRLVGPDRKGELGLGHRIGAAVDAQEHPWRDPVSSLELKP